jgi:DNA-binding NarL/FixJ family response regulator
MNTEIEPIRVLIVDDMAQVRRDLCMVLPLFGEQAGIPVRVVGEACNGQEAIAMAADLQPEVVLMDLAMPVIDGYEATRAIKLQNPATRVIALTVHSDPASREKACQAGADGFFEKGLPLQEILQALRVPT